MSFAKGQDVYPRRPCRGPLVICLLGLRSTCHTQQRQKRCLVCAYLRGLPLSLSRWKRKQAGKKVDKPHILAPPLMAPVNCHILSPQKSTDSFKGTRSQMGQEGRDLEAHRIPKYETKKKSLPKKEKCLTQNHGGRQCSCYQPLVLEWLFHAGDFTRKS